jgi:hypothetical protein
MEPPRANAAEPRHAAHNLLHRSAESAGVTAFRLLWRGFERNNVRCCSLERLWKLGWKPLLRRQRQGYRCRRSIVPEFQSFSNGQMENGQEALPLSDMPSYIQDILDLIEHAKRSSTRNRNPNAVRNDIHVTSIIRPHSTISVNSDLQCIAPLNRFALYGCVRRRDSNLKNALAADCEPADEIKRTFIFSRTLEPKRNRGKLTKFVHYPGGLI